MEKSNKYAISAVFKAIRSVLRLFSPATVRRFADWIAKQAAQDRDRWVLWLPVFLGVGIGIYFSLPVEPSFWIGAASIAVLSSGAWITRNSETRRIPLIVLLTISIGFSIAQWRTMMISAPVLSERVGPASVTGRVIEVQSRIRGLRVVLDDVRISRVAPHLTPTKVRLRLTGKQPDVAPGDWIDVWAVLSPPSSPAAPGAYDFQRRAFFMGIGAVGFSMGRAKRIGANTGSGWDEVMLAVSRLRREIVGRVAIQLENPAGAFATALMTGERGAIPKKVMAAMRDSGLAHLLAISGLHIGLVAGLIFFSTRAMLAALPWVAPRIAVKKWAAVLAIAGALFYTLLAGATVPTLRAFLMIGLVLTGVLVDRQGLSMRTMAWAAAVILLVLPESLLGASFQLSFAAVVALIAGYEVVREYRRGHFRMETGWSRKITLYIAGVALTTLIAGLATGPFAAFHFNRFAGYSLAANLLAVPITALWIMPWAIISTLLMPLGLDHWPLTFMGWGVDAVIDVAKGVAAWPGAVSLVPAMPVWGIATIAIGGLWLCLWRGHWRFLGLTAVATGFASSVFVNQPDILIDGRAGLMAVQTADGGLAVSDLRKRRFERAIWLRRAGQAKIAYKWPAVGISDDGLISCDGAGCVYRTREKSAAFSVALVKSEAALLEDCWRSDLLISMVPVRIDCPVPIRVIDRFDLWREGAHAIWLEEGGIRIESVNASRGDRPWVLRRKNNRR